MKTISLFPRGSEWIPPQNFPDLSEANEIAIDLETCDPNMEKFGPGWPRKDGYIVGYAIAVDGWKGYYPVAHQGGGNLDKRIVEKYIQKVLDTTADKVMHNASYDCGWLTAQGFKINGRVVDTMLAAAVLDENRFSYALNSLGFDYLKEVKSEQGLKEAAADFGVHPKKDMWKLPAMFVGDYAEQDAALTLKLWQHFKILLRKDEVESIFELETNLLPVLIKLTHQGIRFDREKAYRHIKEMKKREEALLLEIKKTCGMHIDIWAAASISLAFDKLKIAYPRSTTGLPSFTKSFLDTNPHPLSKMIVESRELNKTHGTFLQPYLDFSEKDGRIHPHVNQLRSDNGGTVTGRLSMSQPNPQQTPSRHEILGPLVRGLFLPEEGQLWAANDFSSQEPRILIHYASLLNLPGAEKVVDAYRTSPDTDFYQIVANAANIPRKAAKTCIAEGQPVLTDRGLVAIEKITLCDKVWDGVEWVNHDGVVYMGEKEVINYGNLTATPDHDVWTVQWGKIPFGLAASRLDALVSTGNAEQAVRYVDSHQQGNTTKGSPPLHQSSLCMWKRGLEVLRQYKEWQISNVQQMCNKNPPQEGRALGCKLKRGWVFAKTSQRNFPKMQKPQRQGLQTVWSTWNNLRVRVCQGVGGILNYIGSSERLGGEVNRQNRQQQGLYAWQFAMHQCVRQQCQSAQYTVRDLSGSTNMYGSYLGFNQTRQSAFHFFKTLYNQVISKWNDSRGGSQQTENRTSKVYDITNAGPHHRFTVSGVLVSNCTLGMMYGMGKNKLANQLDMPLDEASELIATFHQKVPFLKGTVDAVMRRIEHPASAGSIRTLMGRKCRFPLWEPTTWGINKALPYEQAMVEYGPRIKRAMTYKGLNKLIQGSAADQTKSAMIALDKAGFRVLLQVHDELAVSVNNREEAEQAARIMCDAVQLEVPSRVDVEIGSSWGDAK
jgi:DNA polymerase I-like protein with 3'-5' exonuclease and polymerase domains